MTAQDEIIDMTSQEAPGRRNRRRNRPPGEASALVRALQYAGVLVGVVVIWQLVVTVFHVNPVLVPSATDTAESLWKSIWLSPSSSASYVPDTLETLKEVVIGYVLGCVIGLLMAMVSLYVRLFAILARPLVVAFQSMPKIALAPLFVIWFGFGAESKYTLVAVTVFFPLYVNALVGFQSVDPGLIRMLRSFNASSLQIFRKVQFLAALPFIFAGLEIAVVHAVTVAVAAEFLGGQSGLGVRIVDSEQTLDVPSIFAELILLAIIGVLLHSLVSLLRKRTVTWTGEQLLLKDQ
jgi:NitT/TauT family transport system permease protein